MPPRNRAAGFTLIEMIVTVSIFAILVALGIPTMRTWVANTKVRSVAEALQNGVRLAQAEALRRSRQTVFFLTNSTTPQTDNPPTAAASGSYWAIDSIPAMTDGSETLTFIQSGVLTSQGSTVQIAGPAAICFNSAGRLVSNSSTGVTGGSCALTNASLTTSTLTTGTGTAAAAAAYIYKISLTPGADHPLWVEVAIGGQLRVCDPSQTLSSTNSYGC